MSLERALSECRGLSEKVKDNIYIYIRKRIAHMQANTDNNNNNNNINMKVEIRIYGNVVPKRCFSFPKFGNLALF